MKEKKEKKKGRPKKIVSLFNEYSLYHARVLDIIKICELRDYDVKGHRELILFLYRYFTCCFIQDPEEALQKALELIEQYHFGVTLITKSDLILRDLELLKKINQQTKCVVQMTLTTFDENLCQKLEPGVCTTQRRIEVLKELHKNGIPTIVWLTPILPFINDSQENILKILEECHEAGVKGIICFGMGVTLREGSREYYYKQLDRLFPGMKEKYQMTYNDQYTLNSPHNRDLMNLFFKKCQEYQMMCNYLEIFEYLQEFEEKTPIKKKDIHDFEQLSLF